MASNDPFSATDTLDDALLQVIVTRLETRAKNPIFAKMLQDYLDSMGIDGAGRVLDLGCGTGVATRAVANDGIAEVIHHRRYGEDAAKPLIQAFLLRFRAIHPRQTAPEVAASASPATTLRLVKKSTQLVP